MLKRLDRCAGQRLLAQHSRKRNQRSVFGIDGLGFCR
jgi:hypothetical protein